jgi:hypothetical protein
MPGKKVQLMAAVIMDSVPLQTHGQIKYNDLHSKTVVCIGYVHIRSPTKDF